MYMCVRTFRPQNVSPLAYTFRCVKIAARRHDNGRTPKTDGREDDGENDGRFRSSSFSRLPQFFYWAKSAGKKRNVQTSEGKTSVARDVLIPLLLSHTVCVCRERATYNYTRRASH